MGLIKNLAMFGVTVGTFFAVTPNLFKWHYDGYVERYGYYICSEPQNYTTSASLTLKSEPSRAQTLTI